MRIVAGVLCLGLTGCSWIFQQHLPSEYAGHSEPFCTDSKAWPTIDLVFMGLNAVGAVLAATGEGPATGTAYVIGDAAFAVVHLASSMTGNRWARECRQARRDYYEGGPTMGDEARLREFKKQHAADIRTEQPATPQPRGFFCASSSANAAASFCVRDKPQCEAIRENTAPTVADLAPCTLTEIAWCAGHRCAPSADVCAQRTGAECVEAK